MGHKLSKKIFNTDNNKKCFWVAYQHIRMIFLTISTQIVNSTIRNEQQISILEWFPKDHVRLKAGVIQLCITGMNCIFKYIKTENSYFK